MMSRPRIGTPCQLWYALARRSIAPFHGLTGVVVAVARGKGPRNHAVKVNGQVLIVPAGQLRQIGAPSHD